MAIEMEMDAPEDFSQEGGGLREAGKYHCVVVNVEENPTNKDGKLIDNAVFRASLSVLDGTTAGQKDKEFDLIFFGPKLTHKDHGEMAKKKIWFFASAIGCASLVGGKMKLDFTQAAGRQACLDIEMKESESNGKKYHNPDIAFCNVYHVDDPRVKDWPKDATALGLLPTELRKKPEDFAKKGAKAGTTATTPPTATTLPPQKPADSAAVNLDDL